QNILVTDFGEPALADFGVAMQQSATQTTAGLFDFTTLHAAPELLEGGGTSAATDVYELASSLYQLIAGQSAFRAYDGESPASVILRILRDPVRPLSGQDVPMALSDLLIRAMSKEKAQRPPTAVEFAAELADVEIAQGWNRTQFLIRDPGPLGDGAGPTVTRLPDEVPRGLPSTLAPSGPINPVFPTTRAPEPEQVPQPPAPPAAPVTIGDWTTPTLTTTADWMPPAPDAAPAEPPPLPASAPEPPAARAPVAEVAPPPAQWAPPPVAPTQVAPSDWTRFAPPAPRGRRRIPIEIDDEFLPAAGPGGPLSAADYAPRHGPLGAEPPVEPPAESQPEPGPQPEPEPPPVGAPAPQPPPVPVWAVRPPVGAAPPSTPQFVSDLSLEPMSLRPKATLRAGASSVAINERQLQLRTWFKRSSVEWADVEGFEVQVDSDSGAAQTGQIIALTTLGPVELPGTRRQLGELRYVHALLAAYRIRAQRIANR
ncbi:MAG TPA: protein kinase, partial [Jatrophihabitantaceae bacterium]